MNFRRLLSAILAVAMVFSMAAAMAGCDSQETEWETQESVSGSNVSYIVCVKSSGGLPLAGLAVYVYADQTLTDLKQYGETNAEGVVTFSMPESADYAVVLSGTPKGYQVAPSYAFSGTSAFITLKSAVVSGESMAGAKLSVGDVMYDFSVTTPDGETVTLSDMLAQKDVVVINYWYNGCSACQYEFPYMQEAYEMYSENVGIIAIDPLFDSTSTKDFQESNGLTFTMASVPSNWTSAFNVNGGDVDAYPTTVVVDRYGVICLIEEGALVSLRYWASMFDHFTAEDYQTELLTSADDLLTQILPTCTMDDPAAIAEVLNDGEINVTYRADDYEYSWPFVIGEKNGERCVYSTNAQIDDSYAILYADVTMEAGQALAVDYLASTERGCDILYVIVENEPIYSISGASEEETWETCYPWVAEEAGTYEVALCYLKDSDTSEGEDTVYIKNLRIVDQALIDVPTYLPAYAWSTEDGFEYSYVDIVLNEEDGYYHVGTADGPLLLANLMETSEFNEENSVFTLAYDGKITVDGYNYYEDIVDYCSYASNAYTALYGYCTVNEELAQLLKVVASVAGFSGEENEWLKLCKYYKAYGTDEQFPDPIAGLATFSAYEARQGVNVPTNYFYYDRAIIPRGLLAEFVPAVSGVYRITSRNDSIHGVEGWIFGEGRTELYCFEQSERMFNDSEEVSMLYYMEAGKSYYIDIAFWDVYEVGYIYYDIEYVGSTYNLFRTCAPGYFTYDSDATGDAMYYLISGGIDVVLGTDGIYYEDRGLDENGEQIYGSQIYCDFVGVTSLFSSPIASVDSRGNVVAEPENAEDVILGMIDLGGFDFSKTEDDLYILAIMQTHNNSPEETDAYLRELWGEDYDAYAEIYQLEDVYAGIYHGTGEDLTEEMRAYYSDVITAAGEKQGCVVVTQRLAEILQMLMDKYTFKNVDDAWIKLCYYYQYLGPEA